MVVSFRALSLVLHLFLLLRLPHVGGILLQRGFDPTGDIGAHQKSYFRGWGYSPKYK